MKIKTIFIKANALFLRNTWLGGAGQKEQWVFDEVAFLERRVCLDTSCRSVRISYMNVTHVGIHV